MGLIDILCINGNKVGLTFHEMRITRGFIKVYHEELGNFAIPRDEVKKIEIEFVEDEE